MADYVGGERLIIDPTSGPPFAGIVVTSDQQEVVLLYEGSKLPVPGGTPGAVVRIATAEIASVERLGIPGVPATIARRYEGSQRSATAQFQDEAPKFAALGFQPTSQQWVPGSWGGAAFVLALLLFIFVVGILILLYLLMVKPDRGVLTVTYQRSVAPASALPPTEPTKVCPRCAETIKAAAIVCRFCGHEFGGTPDEQT